MWPQWHVWKNICCTTVQLRRTKHMTALNARLVEKQFVVWYLACYTCVFITLCAHFIPLKSLLFPFKPIKQSICRFDSIMQRSAIMLGYLFSFRHILIQIFCNQDISGWIFASLQLGKSKYWLFHEMNYLHLLCSLSQISQLEFYGCCGFISQEYLLNNKCRPTSICVFGVRLVTLNIDMWVLFPTFTIAFIYIAAFNQQ